MYKDYHGSLYGNYRQVRFCDVYDNVNDFLSDYANNGIPKTIPTGNETPAPATNGTAKVLFYLLYGRYGNSIIASSDTEQFKYRLFSIIFQGGLGWSKKLEIQQKLSALDLSSDDWLIGSTQIYNHANNPSTTPDTQTFDEIEFIDDQNVTKTRKGKLEGYFVLKELIDQDVTNEFIKKFNTLFLQVVEPEKPLYYITEGEE